MPILDHNCGPLEDFYITCSVTVEGGYGMYLLISVGASGGYSWELMGGM